MTFHWFVPTTGVDGRQVVSGGHAVSHGSGGRPASVPYLGQVARSAEQLGFEELVLSACPHLDGAYHFGARASVPFGAQRAAS